LQCGLHEKVVRTIYVDNAQYVLRGDVASLQVNMVRHRRVRGAQHADASADRRSLTEFVAGDYLRIANVELAVGDYGVVPGLPLSGLKAAQLMVPAWIRRDEDRFAFFRCHKEQRLVGQQQELAAAIAPTLPPLLAGFQVDAGQHAGIEPECRAAADHEIVEGMRSTN
jgi:hypothetical protein